MRDTYEVLPVNEREISWLARRKLRQIRREGKGGMLAYSKIPGGNRAAPWVKRVVVIVENGKTLFSASPGFQFPKWVDLRPGGHEIRFSVGGWGQVDFTRSISLRDGEILIVGCKTTYSRSPRPKNPRPNQWYVGVVGAVPAVDGSSTNPFPFG